MTPPCPVAGCSARGLGGCQPGAPAQRPAAQQRRPRLRAVRRARRGRAAAAAQGAAGARAVPAAAGRAWPGVSSRGACSRRGGPGAGGGVQPAEARRLVRGIPVGLQGRAPAVDGWQPAGSKALIALRLPWPRWALAQAACYTLDSAAPTQALYPERCWGARQLASLAGSLPRSLPQPQGVGSSGCPAHTLPAPCLCLGPIRAGR